MLSQLDEHAPYGGVVPEIAARAHVEAVDAIIERALDEAGVALSDLDAIAATAGPGLIGGVMVGLTTAKALALAAGKPLIAINHLEAHALTARLTEGAEFPFLLLLISGGHCQLLGVEGVGRFKLYGTTIDDAVGEAFDKTAKLLGLPYPGGPSVEASGAQRKSQTFCASPTDARARGRGFFVFGLEDGGSPDRARRRLLRNRRSGGLVSGGRHRKPDRAHEVRDGNVPRRFSEGRYISWWREASPPIRRSAMRWRVYARRRASG